MTNLNKSDLRDLLANLRLKFFVKSEKGDYEFEYYTDRFLGDDPENPTLTRAYKMRDCVRNSSFKSPWDEFNLEKQVGILSVLLDDGRYKIDRVVQGWRIKCNECEEELRGEIWEPVPVRCPHGSGKTCNAKLNLERIEEIEVP